MKNLKETINQFKIFYEIKAEDPKNEEDSEVIKDMYRQFADDLNYLLTIID